MLEHPEITRTRRIGYPVMNRREKYGIDGLGNEVFTGESILAVNDEFFLVDELFQESIEILEMLGATHEIAK